MEISGGDAIGKDLSGVDATGKDFSGVDAAGPVSQWLRSKTLAQTATNIWARKQLR